MNLAEQFKFVPVLSDGDLNAGVTLDTDSINMKNYHHATFIVGLQSLAGASATLEVYSGATEGACTSARTVNYAFGGAAQGSANCDVLAAWTSAASITLTNTTYDNYMLIIEVPATATDLANKHNWLTLRFTDPGGATGNVQVHAILKPRFGNNQAPTALA
jgi:hypothetical protein